MNIEEARNYCLSLKGATECFPFDETTLVFKVMDKMFALIPLTVGHRICLKCDPEYAIELREEYTCVEPAFHFNKKYWNQVDLNSELKNEEIKALINHSLDEVLKKFSKKKQEEYHKSL